MNLTGKIAICNHNQREVKIIIFCHKIGFHNYACLSLQKKVFKMNFDSAFALRELDFSIPFLQNFFFNLVKNYVCWQGWKCSRILLHFRNYQKMYVWMIQIINLVTDGGPNRFDFFTHFCKSHKKVLAYICKKQSTIQ